jgi:hypothetical protein
MGNPVIDMDDLELSRAMGHGGRFEAELAPVGPLIGASATGTESRRADHFRDGGRQDGKSRVVLVRPGAGVPPEG